MKPLTLTVLIATSIIIVAVFAIANMSSYRKYFPIESSTTHYNYSVEIAVIVDNYGYDDFASEWGISVLLKIVNNENNWTILFDTGSSDSVLKHNLYKLGYSISDIDFIVISHEHFDHLGGLKAFSNMKLRVYVPKSMSDNAKEYIRNLGLKLIEVNETFEVVKNVYIVGEVYGPPWEQALAINVDGKGLFIIVGCSHPGVEKIVKKAYREIGVKPYAVLGGFHMAGASHYRIVHTVNELLALGIKKIYPIHCSGDAIREYLRKNFPETYGNGHVGLVLKE